MNGDAELHVVTGAFGLTGRHIARRLLDRGVRVRTLTNRPAAASPFGDRVEPRLLRFDDADALTDALRGATTLYNTYWVRFPRGGATHESAVANTRTLLGCAAEAGVRRVVQISIANPDEDSPYSYYRGKAHVERALRESGHSYSILRPALLFGDGDVLINNIAWMLRRLPVFGVFGRGEYRVQPVFVEDLADLAVRCAEARDDLVMNAVGPEMFEYEDLVRRVRRAIGGRARIIHVSPTVGLAIGGVLGRFVGDVIVTRPEVQALMDGLLACDGPPTCPTAFTTWLAQNADRLGRRYASELSRHFRSGATFGGRESR